MCLYRVLHCHLLLPLLVSDVLLTGFLHMLTLSRMPVSAETMNYSSAITGGLTLIITLFYPWQCKNGFRSPVEVVRANSTANVVKDDQE